MSSALPDGLRYLSEADVGRLGLDPVDCRDAVAAAFRAHAQGRVITHEATHIDLAPGHGFRSLCVAWPEQGVACNKWFGVRPEGVDPRFPGVNALVTLNHCDSGVPLAVFAAGTLTGLRTAAMSAVAAAALAAPDPETLGFVGCGLQARFHLDAMRASFPSIRRVLAFSRSEPSALALADIARGFGLEARACVDAETVVRGSRILVTSVPLSAALRPFLDPRWIAPGSFVSAIDVARSWIPGHLRELDLLATDDHAQQAALAPLTPTLGPLGSFDADLATLAGDRAPHRNADARAMFIFRGHALGDLAVAMLAWRRASELGIGLELAR